MPQARNVDQAVKRAAAETAKQERDVLDPKIKQLEDSKPSEEDEKANDEVAEETTRQMHLCEDDTQGTELIKGTLAKQCKRGQWHVREPNANGFIEALEKTIANGKIARDANIPAGASGSSGDLSDHRYFWCVRQDEAG